MMENPVGDDDTDINLYQQLHQLEVHGSSRFAWCRGLPNRRLITRNGGDTVKGMPHPKCTEVKFRNYSNSGLGIIGKLVQICR